MGRESTEEGSASSPIRIFRSQCTAQGSRFACSLIELIRSLFNVLPHMLSRCIIMLGGSEEEVDSFWFQRETFFLCASNHSPRRGLGAILGGDSCPRSAG